MGKVERIEQQEELAQLREWFAAFDAEGWDRQFEADAQAGKLDVLGEQALKSHPAGRTTRL